MDKVIDRIRKLMALANSSNEHEAAAAAARSAELMARHRLTEVDWQISEGVAQEVGDFELDRSRRRISWLAVLAAGVAAGFACRAYSSRWRGQVSLRIVGRPADVDAVRYMYAYLAKELRRLADEEWATSPRAGTTTRQWKNAFRVAAAKEIAGRMREAQASVLANAPEGSTAIVKAHDAALGEVWRNLRVRKGPAVRVSSGDGMSAGRAAGQAVNLGGNPQIGRPTLQLGPGPQSHPVTNGRIPK
jgi:hypothetical protein